MGRYVLIIEVIIDFPIMRLLKYKIDVTEGAREQHSCDKFLKICFLLNEALLIFTQNFHCLRVECSMNQ
jgi:hypothetical protein